MYIAPFHGLAPRQSTKEGGREKEKEATSTVISLYFLTVDAM